MGWQDAPVVEDAAPKAGWAGAPAVEDGPALRPMEALKKREQEFEEAAKRWRLTGAALKPGQTEQQAVAEFSGLTDPRADREMAEIEEVAQGGDLQYGDSLPYGAAKVGASMGGFAVGGPAGATAAEAVVRQVALAANLKKAIDAGAIDEDRAASIMAKEMAAGTTEDMAWNVAVPLLGQVLKQLRHIPGVESLIAKVAAKIPRNAQGKIVPADEARQRARKVEKLQDQAQTPAAKQAVGDLAARTDDYLPTPGQVSGEAGFGERVGRAADPDKFAKQEKVVQDAAEGMREKALDITLDPAAPSMRGGIGSTIQDLAEQTEKAMKNRLRPTFQAADDLKVRVDVADVLARAKAAQAVDASTTGGRLKPGERADLDRMIAELEEKLGTGDSAEATLDFMSRQKEKVRDVSADSKPSKFYETILNGLIKSADDAFTVAANGAGKPEVVTALKGAQSQYREMMETIYEDAVKQALKTNKTEDIGRFFWQAGNVSEPKQLQKLLALAQREGAMAAQGAEELNRKMTQGFLQEAVPNIDTAARWSTMLKEKPGLRDTWNTLTSAPGGKELRAAMEVLEEAAKIATRGSAPVQVGGMPIKRAAGGSLGVSFVTGTIHPGMFATGVAFIPMTRMMATAYAQGNKGVLNMIARTLRASSAGTAAGAKAAQAAWPELQKFAAENGIDLTAGGPSGASEPDPTVQ